ncbi:CheR family methyltransferase [Rubrivivax gelatinosus]|uniref:CheR family methyltransferase n=1 Tax=Rubrivivax gelatinosus TaxID=28068 RepID=UPI001907005B|nr:protein-glutamate O-methyltransferase CheR [Rubrivivax gelatinosus]
MSDGTFREFAALMHAAVGLSFNDSKKALVSSRLTPRLRRLEIEDFDAYLALIAGDPQGEEFQTAVDLLTTNETYFFREPAHYELLQRELLAERPRTLAVWSAAASFGDEAYSTAMLLADLQQQGSIGADWTILGTDISDRVLRSACAAVYPQERLRDVTPQRLKRYCLRGEGESEGLVQMHPKLSERVRFGQLNLCQPIETIGPFDVVFLRNVLIYFDAETKRAVVDRVLTQLRPGGLFFTGTAEGRVSCATPLQALAPGAFRKALAA